MDCKSSQEHICRRQTWGCAGSSPSMIIRPTNQLWQKQSINPSVQLHTEKTQQQKSLSAAARFWNEIFLVFRVCSTPANPYTLPPPRFLTHDSSYDFVLVYAAQQERKTTTIYLTLCPSPKILTTLTICPT